MSGSDTMARFFRGWRTIGLGKHFFVVFVLLTVPVVSQDTLDPQPIVFAGQLNIGLLLNIHKASDDGVPCTRFNPAAVQQLMGAIWAVKVLNNQTEPNATQMGVVIYDTCGSPEVAVRQALRILRNSNNLLNDGCRAQTVPPVIGVIGVDDSSGLGTSASLFNAFDVPLMIASPSGADNIFGVHNVLVTVPDMASQVKPVMSLLKAFRWNSVHVVTASAIALKEFKEVAAATGITVIKGVQLLGNHFDQESLNHIIDVSKLKPSIVAAILSPEELRYVSKLISPHRNHGVVWVIASPALDRNTLQELSPILGPGVLLEPHSPELAGFRAFFMNALTNTTAVPALSDPLLAYLEHEHGCSWRADAPKTATPLCKKLSALQIVAKYHQEPSVSHVTEAVSALAAALRIVTLDLCHNAVGCHHLQATGSSMLNALHKLGYAFRRDLPPELEGARVKFTNAGRMVSIHSHIVFFNGTTTPTLIGWYSDELGINLDAVPSSLGRSHLEASEYQHIWVERLSAANRSRHALDSLLPKEVIYDIRMERVSHSASVRRAWAATVLALASIGILATAYVLVYVLVRICDDTLIGNQFLGVMLLFGVAALYATCVLFVLPPSEAMCGWRLVVHSTVHALCYGLLLVKIMVVRSLSLLGLGGSVSHANQALTLFFIVALQISVSVQWWVVAGPLIQTDVNGVPHCSPTHTTFIALHAPAMTALALTVVYSIFARNLHHNDHEGRRVLLVSVVCVPVWVGWAVVHHSASAELQEPTVCAHLITVATVIVLGVFVPKLRAISRQAAAFRHKKMSTKSATTIFTLPTELGATRLKSRHGSGRQREGILNNPVFEAYNRFPASVLKRTDSTPSAVPSILTSRDEHDRH